MTLDALSQLELLRALAEGEADARREPPAGYNTGYNTGPNDLARHRAEHLLRALERAGFVVTRQR